MPEPSITLRAIHDSGAVNAPITRVVIHATCGGQGFPAESAAGVAHATARYFQQASAGGSAHYVCDIAAEEHCVPDNVVAWHAPPNVGSIGIEVCGEASYTRAQWLDPKVWPAVVRAAARCRELCDRFGIPKAKLSSSGLLAGAHGVCGHVDVSNAWHQTDHSDPGAGFPWDLFMAEVTRTPAAPKPVAIPPVPALPRWTLPPGHYYGLITGPATSHGGITAAERTVVQAIQRRLIAKGYVPGIHDWRSSWADGKYEGATAQAVAAFQRAQMPGTKFFGEVWADDYARLAR